MENNIAKTLRETADKYHEEQATIKRNVHAQFVEKTIIPNAQQCAAIGGYRIPVYVPSRYDKSMIIKIAESHNFIVENDPHSCMILVKW